ncbi:MAG: 6-carboxytetrahydropterin synthase [Anaerohalosphaeraceae bacterium]|nr:6-carboxytetrahydropterin synthase [Anaerohalosphaeraceae bacterium]
MYRVTVETQFQASHQLTLADGQEAPHSHNWLVSVAVETEKLDKYGLAIDFSELKEIINQETGKLGPGKIEDNPYFDNVSASAENVAKYLFISIKKRFDSEKKLEYVEVTEAIDCKGRYSE